ncbi:MAG: hypothetical protein Q4F49_08600 [Pseudoxanthomonas suwonensis]|nr:hypothetical protein [Pseudoxanthomonas suwonensis]
MLKHMVVEHRGRRLRVAIDDTPIAVPKRLQKITQEWQRRRDAGGGPLP